MSVRERMKNIQEIEEAEKVSRRSQAEKTAQEAEKIRKEKYRAGLAEALSVQSRLLEELRQVGIVSLLEEVAGPIKPIELLREDDGSKEYWKYLQDLVGEIGESIERRFSGEWTPVILPPKKQKDGSPEHTLKIEISRVQVEALRPNMSPNFTPSMLTVTLEYGEDKNLRIAGKKTTFKGNVDPGNLSQYEEAIANAFLKPDVGDTHSR